MLSGLYIIDGVDIWTTYGAAILKGSYNSLLAYPKRTTPDIEDWFEEDYVDVDYSSLFFDASDVTIRVGIYGISKADLLNKREGLKTLLNQAGNRNIVISGINATIELRYKGGGNPTASPLIAGNQFYLEQDILFSNDKPTQLLDSIELYSNSLSSVVGDSIYKSFAYRTWNDYEINNIPISHFGMGVKSMNGSALTFGDLKDPLVNKYDNIDGASAFVLQPLKLKQKELIVSLVMAHDDIIGLMNKYVTFFGEISKKTPLEIFSKSTEEKYCGYYAKQDNLSIYISPNLNVLEFNITLIITEIRDIKDYIVWATEKKEIIMTEDNNNAIIY